MKYAVIENGKVINIVLAEPEYAAEQGWVECSEKGGIGWDYDGSTFVDNRPRAVPPTPSAPTKEELLAQLNAIAAQIQALG